MDINELQLLHDKLVGAKYPEEIFGPPPLDEKALKNTRNMFARICHPDKNGNSMLSNLTFGRLESIYHEALSRMKNGQYGNGKVIFAKNATAPYIPFMLSKKYKAVKAYELGDIADLHVCDHIDRASKLMLAKIVRNTADNDLMRLEVDHLRQVRTLMQTRKTPWIDCVPEVYDSFTIDDGSAGKKSRVNVIEYFKGFYSAKQIRALIPDGVDARTLVWMWKRLLLLMDWSHHAGIVHGAILPQHIMFYPDNDGKKDRDLRKHAIRLVDWCYSINYQKTSSLSAWVAGSKDFYPPEVAAKKGVDPCTDLFMGAKTMLYLAGGDVVKNVFPSHIPKELADCILKCLKAEQSRRPRDIQVYFKEFEDVAGRVFGPRKFHQFHLPIVR